MLTNFIITGDTHGDVKTRLGNIQRNNKHLNPEETGVVILGDAGFNFWLSKRDDKNKKVCNAYGYTIYCVRGNHEERPENLGYELIFDQNVDGWVYFDPVNPNIRYFKDGGLYGIQGHSTLVIGGAYSVDKYYRLQKAMERGDSFTGWFPNEQLTEQERFTILEKYKNQQIDIILTHTCPISWEPTDLFLGFINQEQVDKSMELWLDEVRSQVDWKLWLFGHFHADRIERPNVEQFYMHYDNLTDIWDRWHGDKELDWSLTKSPYFHMGG